jgi:hypothetical protein
LDSTSPPKDNRDLVQHRANFEKLTKEYDAVVSRNNAKLKALNDSWAEREERIEKERAYEKTRALAKVKALEDLSKPSPQVIDSYTRKAFEPSQKAQPKPTSQTASTAPTVQRKQNAFQRFYNNVFSDNSPKVVKALPAQGYEAYNAKLNAIERIAKNTPAVQPKAPVLSEYELRKVRENEVREAKKRDLERAHSFCLANKTREIDELGIPYVGSDKVTDLKPGQRINIPVQKISPKMPKEQEIRQYKIEVKSPRFLDKKSNKLPDRTGKKTETPNQPLRDYANYSTSEGVGSDTSKGNLENAKRAFSRAGQNLVDAFTASSFNPERKQIGYKHSTDDFVSYSKNWFNSIKDTVDPDSEVYNEQGIPARIIGFPTAIVGGALELPFEVLSFSFANISDNTLEHLVLGFPDELAEGFAQTINSPGNLVSKKGFGYHLRRAYSSTIRFFKNVFTGKGFRNSLSAKKAFAQKGRLASLESAFNTAAIGAGAAGVSFLNSDSVGFDVFNPVAPVVPPVVPGAGVSGGRGGKIPGR